LALKEFSAKEVLSISFAYGQRHIAEIERAAFIAKSWGVAHNIVDMSALGTITNNALMDSSIPISQKDALPANTLVLGRNGLMARLGAVIAHTHGAKLIYMGVMEAEERNRGYRDCSRSYMDLKQEILRIDLADPLFEIRTPLVFMNKYEAFCMAHEEGILEFLLEQTISCYEGLEKYGCRVCPSCLCRNSALEQFLKDGQLWQQFP
jgi:7-cyano-7-deazaguanine synthase